MHPKIMVIWDSPFGIKPRYSEGQGRRHGTDLLHVGDTGMTKDMVVQIVSSTGKGGYRIWEIGIHDRTINMTAELMPINNKLAIRLFI